MGELYGFIVDSQGICQALRCGFFTSPSHHRIEKVMRTQEKAREIHIQDINGLRSSLSSFCVATSNDGLDMHFLWATDSNEAPRNVVDGQPYTVILGMGILALSDYQTRTPMTPSRPIASEQHCLEQGTRAPKCWKCHHPPGSNSSQRRNINRHLRHIPQNLTHESVRLGMFSGRKH